MNRKGYKSLIPKSAREVVDKCYPHGTKAESSFFVARKRVGRREWWDDGQLMSEWGLKDGKKHGNVLDFDPNGQLSFVEPYRNGRPHGKATQFASDGSVLICYIMQDGVGLDLWCQGDGKLSEERYCPADGELGYTRWWNCDNKSIHSEQSWLNSSGWHGILREWNTGERLRRGFPQFYVKGQRVSKKQYCRACESDSLLPQYIPEKDQPFRNLPPEYLAQMKSRS